MKSLPTTTRLRRDHPWTRCATALILGSVLFAPGIIEAAAPTPGGTRGRPIRIPNDPAADRVVETLWNGGLNGYVRIERQEPAAQRTNQHPVSVTEEQLQVVLGQFLLASDDPAPLLNRNMVNALAEPLTEALAQASPQQDVTFAAVGRSGGPLNFISPRAVTTGRVFYQDGRLNVVFGMVQEEIEDMLQGVGLLPIYLAGSRAAPVQTKIRVLPGAGMQYAAAQRGDWIEIGREAWPDASGRVIAQQPAQPAANSVLRGAAIAPDAPPPSASVVAAPPPSTSLPATPAPAQVAAAPATSAGEEVYYQHFETRLRALQRLRDQDLISEEEYGERREAILGEI